MQETKDSPTDLPEEKKSPGIGLPEQPSFFADLQGMVNHPDDLDPATDRLGIAPSLINPHMASAVDLSDLGLGKGVHLPVQISRRRGGRKSLYYLHPGEKVLAGLYVTGEGMAFRYMARETGRSIPARTGDEYSEEIRSIRGDLLQQRRGRLEVTNPEKGEGQLVIESPGKAAKPRFTWWFWSFYATIDFADLPN
jgi:hypothetical protein